MVNHIIDGVVDFFSACELLQDGVMRVDALGDAPVEYSITTGSVYDPVVKRYIDGSTLRQFQFNFGAANILRKTVCKISQTAGSTRS